MPSTPSVTVRVPWVVRAHCGGGAELAVPAATMRDALLEIGQQHPALHRSICDETGAVRRHINLFINTAHMRDRDGLDTTLVPGDVITILPAVSGG